LVVLGIALTWAPTAAHAFSPNDTYINNEWYANTIGLKTAWDTTLGLPSVKIAILDTGVVTTTPDLAGRILPQTSTTGSAPFSDATLIGNGVDTTLHHGTWTASVAAMAINNGQGGAGIGNFTIMPITVTDNAGHNSSDWIAAAIRAAADAGARAISISQSTLDYGTLDAAAAYARTKGALTFVAGGNSNSRIDLGSLPNLIMVSGTNTADGRWVTTDSLSGSTWGPQTDLSAPAENIVVADPSVGYGLISGTSFSAPIAAGVAGLAWSINPLLTPDQVEQMLYSTAVDLGDPGKDEIFGWGRINAAGVVQQALLSLNSVPEPSSVVLMLFGFAGTAAVARRKK
jgi:subtilisin family serine protease